MSMNVCVIGAGKMGLPLACHFASGGASVLACDVNPLVVDKINSGICPIDEPDLPELLAAVVQQSRLKATIDTVEAVKQSEVVVVIVPVVLTGDHRADMSVVESVTRQISQGLHRGVLVCYETTLPVGATRGYLLPLLEDSGFKAGQDFFLAYSPERVKSQVVMSRLGQTPKIVGGIEKQSAQQAEAFYRKYLGAPVINLGTVEAAEMVKLAGMVYRDVNIALMNELARYAEAAEIDIEQVVEAANTDGETHLLRPGIGVGGHCTPVYPYFLIHDAEKRGAPITLAERARQTNDSQATHAVNRLQKALGSLGGTHVLILGLGFRPQVKEHMCSTAFLLRDELLRRGAEVRLHDPLYTDAELQAHGFTPGKLSADPAPEVLILNTAHAVYNDLDLAQMSTRGLKAVFDGRLFWKPDVVRRHGLLYLGIGRPEERWTGKQAGESETS
ncbi:MAG: nucleotide sugar dehydrogenase [Nitrospiraceae bacterium]